GVVLAPMIEMALRQSLAMSDGQYSIFLSRPISATLLVVALILVVLGLKPLVTRGLDWRARLALAEKREERSCRSLARARPCCSSRSPPRRRPGPRRPTRRARSRSWRRSRRAASPI